MSMDTMREILVHIGIETEALDSSGPQSRVRADLGLDSTETTDLEVTLKERFGISVDLWDKVDYSLAQLAQAIEDAR